MREDSDNWIGKRMGVYGMKRMLALFSIIAIAFSAAACKDKLPELTEEDPEIEEQEETQQENCRQCYVITLGEKYESAVVGASLSGYCEGDITDKNLIFEDYNDSFLSEKIPGLLGSGVDLFIEDLESPGLTIYYDDSLLKGVPEENILVVCYDYDSGYSVVEDAMFFTDYDFIELGIKYGKNDWFDGAYYLVDAYRWYSALGYDASEYEYEGMLSDWEFSCNAGDIPELADPEWAEENAPNFSVSTPEELASVVYYVNTHPNGSMFTADPDDFSYTLELENDIDLTGYEWSSMGWAAVADRYSFSGEINGNGYTINGMTIDGIDTDTGFVGYSTDLVVHDISFTNASVSSTGCVGIAGGQIYGDGIWENVYVEGVVEGGKDDYGSVIGRTAYITFENCTSDAVVNGEPFPYCCYQDMLKQEVPVVEYYTLIQEDDGSITLDAEAGSDYQIWTIEYEGKTVWEGYTTNLLTLTPEFWEGADPGTYTVYLVSWDYDYDFYIRVSNIVEYEVK